MKVYDVSLKNTGAGKRELPRTGTKQFSLVGVSWTGAAKPLDGIAQVRTHSPASGAWGPWHDLELDVAPPERPGAGMRGASQPLWVGPSDGVQVQVLHEDGSTAQLPKGLEVNLVDPGVVTPAETKVSSAEPVAYAAAASTAFTAPLAPPSSVPQPSITSRADWGANESLSPDPSEYNADVEAVFVHHTDGVNDYACPDSASIVRGIYAYHTQVNGWNDIGYNFLVDKCGTIFEGRKGGVGLSVLGAHTYGWNRESAGIAVLGGHTATKASDAALVSVARMAAFKLGQYGADPAGTVQLTAGATQKNYFNSTYVAGAKYPFQRISAHRDGYNTQCPGNALYTQLPAIAALAAGPVQGLKIATLSGAGLSGSTYYTQGTITVRWSATTPGSLIKAFQVLVDGRAAATTSGADSDKAIPLAPGSHTVAVRAVHQSGKATTTPALNVVAETTAPTFTSTPKLTLRTGTVNTSAVPVTLHWKVTDDKALRHVKLLSPATVTFSSAATLSHRTAKSNTATTWPMRAYDHAGNYRNASGTYTPVILQETAAVKSGKWSLRSSGSYLGGTSHSSSSKGASLTWAFTGRSASWVVSRASGSGQAHIYMDGAKISTVDLKTASTLYRQAIWTKTWSTSAKHTLKIVVAGTSGRPTITTDGLVYIK